MESLADRGRGARSWLGDGSLTGDPWPPLPNCRLEAVVEEDNYYGTT